MTQFHDATNDRRLEIWEGIDWRQSLPAVACLMLLCISSFVTALQHPLSIVAMFGFI